MATEYPSNTWADRIAEEIKAEFCERVVPSHLVVYLRCLQRPDVERVLQVRQNSGDWYGAHELFLILQRRSDWISDLTSALKLPDVGLLDFGKKLERLCQQIKVKVNAPEDSVDGDEGIADDHKDTSNPKNDDNIKRSPDSTMGKRKIDVNEDVTQESNTDIGAKKKCSDGKHCKPDNGSVTPTVAPGVEEKHSPVSKIAAKDNSVDEDRVGKARSEMVYNLHGALFRSMTSVEDLKETLSLAENTLIKIDKMARRCLEITFRMDTVEKLDAFWQLYVTGGLKAAITRDILTPHRRQMIRKEANMRGIQLDDIDLDVSIQEDNYIFVRDTLMAREDTLLVRNSVESIIQHGEGTQRLSKYQCKEALKRFRASLPPELEEVFSDPYIQDNIPEYFIHLVTSSATEAIRNVYQMVVDKLRKEIQIPDIQNKSETKLALLSDFDSSCNTFHCREQDESVYLTSTATRRKLAIAQSVLQHISVPTKADGNTIEIFSDLVLAYIDVDFLRYLTATSDFSLEIGQIVEKITCRKFFWLVAGFMLEPIDIRRLIKISIAGNAVSQYLVYRWLLVGEIRDINYDLLHGEPFLLINHTKGIKEILEYLAVEGFELCFSIIVPPDATYKTGGEPVRSEGEFESSQTDQSIKEIKGLRVLTNMTADEPTNYFDIWNTRLCTYLKLPNDNYTARFSIPATVENPLSVLIAVAKIVNLIGSGMVKLQPIYGFEQEGTPEEFILSYRLSTSKVFKRGQHVTDEDASNDDTELAKNVKNNDEILKHETQKGKSYETMDTEKVIWEAAFDVENRMGGEMNLTGSLSIDLNQYQVKEKDAVDLESAFKSGLQVEEMDLTKTCIPASLVARLCRAGITANITRLILSDNELFKTKDDIKNIGLEFLSGLELLDVRNCHLGDSGVVAMCQSLQKLRMLRSIDFSMNRITDTGLKELCRALKGNHGLRAVRLHENSKYGALGGFILRFFLEDLAFLEIVNVCFCGLGDKGLEHLALALKNKKMRKINIRQNNITQDGSRKFFDIMRNCKHLNHLEYGNNEIGSPSFFYGFPTAVPIDNTQTDHAFLEMMKSNAESLEYVGLWKCGIDRTTLLENDAILSRFSLLTEFVLQSNGLTPKHGAAIGRSLVYLKNIQLLMLRDNDIGSEGAIELTKGISEAPTLREIILDRNNITDISALEKLVEVTTQTLPDLIKLDISYNVEMLDMAGEGSKYKKLVATAEDSLFEPDTEEGDLQTKIEGWLKLRKGKRDGSRGSQKSKSTLIVI